jgi:hypothetical protein
MFESCRAHPGNSLQVGHTKVMQGNVIPQHVPH